MVVFGNMLFFVMFILGLGFVIVVMLMVVEVDVIGDEV